MVKDRDAIRFIKIQRDAEGETLKRERLCADFHEREINTKKHKMSSPKTSLVHIARNYLSDKPIDKTFSTSKFSQRNRIQISEKSTQKPNNAGTC
jgi:hypothetical protein